MHACLEVRVESNGGSGSEGEREEVAEGEPVPKLAKDEQTDCSLHAHVTRARLERYGHISASCLQQREREREQ